jgi:hypothetical protein
MRDLVASASSAAAGAMHDDIEEEHGWRWTTGLLCSLGRSVEYARAVQTTSWAWTHSTGGGTSSTEVGDAFKIGRADGDYGVPYSLTQSITAMLSAMFSTVIRRATPSLHQQARPRFAAAAHTQTAAAAAAGSSSSPSKLSEGEQAIYDKLLERFEPAELIVQDISGSPPSCPHPLRTL